MSTVGFALKDFKRRKAQSTLTIVALGSCVAATVSTVLIAQNLGLSIPLIAAGRLGSGFVSVLSDFAAVLIFLSFLAGAAMAYFFVSANMSERTSDIGIMKGIGCLTDQVFGYFATQLSLMVLMSCVIGTIIAVFLTYSFIQLNGTNLPTSHVFIDSSAVLISLIAFAAATHLLGIMPVVKAIQSRPSDALSPYYLRGVSFRSASSITSKLGLSFRVAYREFTRRKLATLSTVICLAVVISISTVGVAGTAIANQTTQNYLRRAVGENVVAIGHPTILSQCLLFLNQSLQQEQRAKLNFLDSKFLIADSTVSKLSNITGVVKADARLFLETTVIEQQLIFVVDSRYITVGDRRSADAFVFGVDSEHLVNNWLIAGRTLEKTDEYSIVLGDSLASTILSSPFEQKVSVLERDFIVVGVALDPLNLGYVAYLPLKTLCTAINQNGTNILLLKADPEVLQQVLEEIQMILEGTGLEFAELNPYVERHAGFLQSVWSSFTLLSIFFLATATLCLFTYMTQRTVEQEQEFGIIRALGAKPGKIVKIVLIQTFLIAFASGAVGIPIGLLIPLVFLIPEATISTISLFTIAAWPILTVCLLSLASLYPAIKIAHKPISTLVCH